MNHTQTGVTVARPNRKKLKYVVVVNGRAVKIVEDTYYTLLSIGDSDTPNQFTSIDSANYVAYMLGLQAWEVKRVGRTVCGDLCW